MTPEGALIATAVEWNIRAGPWRPGSPFYADIKGAGKMLLGSIMRFCGCYNSRFAGKHSYIHSFAFVALLCRFNQNNWSASFLKEKKKVSFSLFFFFVLTQLKSFPCLTMQHESPLLKQAHCVCWMPDLFFSPPQSRTPLLCIFDLVFGGVLLVFEYLKLNAVFRI